ncbi:cytochrome-c oxidase, cbb3-type subunit III [Paracoccus sp. SCSIO 75233]|uniref:cytochrome-c oxidase, cbb3-type subunit III n=1 Tax=Paracoccus sp. SCSIO 75233 TaxID=3017782 RepID=UPI0022F0206C|nr:cytochrome-c oxidase, cbb3-type subunit III [Paracoccus sp. SCSIO 75233]WBU53998.1 cytochrome-c oxidase, cbb3-type subunit III [Paracoccus sp. SCSIO 75233]
MSVKERDPLTGHLTTGHEWDGIVELNTPVPRPVWFFIATTAIWSFIIWLLLPTWPLVSTYTKGLLSTDQRKEVEQAVLEADEARADWAARITDLPVEKILADPDLAEIVRTSGPQLFGDNCAACHGLDANGGPGFPSLTDSAWLWGGEFDTVMETIRVGINSDHPETRFGQMMAFGRDGILSRDDIRAVAAYVRSLSGTSGLSAQAEQGKSLFADNCVTCHAEDGSGDIAMGAPDLTDDFWIYGGSSRELFDTIFGGRQGWMPAWEERLPETERKILAIYLEELGQQDGNPQ